MLNMNEEFLGPTAKCRAAWCKEEEMIRGNVETRHQQMGSTTFINSFQPRARHLSGIRICGRQRIHPSIMVWSGEMS